MPLADSTETALRGRDEPLFDGLIDEGEFVWPAYGGRSLVNVPATLFGMLGCHAPRLSPPLPPELWSDLGAADAVVLLLLDAVGYLRLRRHLATGRLPFLERVIEAGCFTPLTSVFPSTTTAALASLYTGRTPAAHGMLAYVLYLKEFATVAEMIRLRPHYGRGNLTDWGLDPEAFLPVPGIGSLLAEQGVLAAQFVHGAIAKSPLSRMFYRGFSSLCPVYSPADMFVQMRQFLVDHPKQKALVSAYWGSVDTISHARGPGGAGWAAEVETLIWALEHHFWRPMPAALRERTVLVLAADHGQVRVDHDQALYVNEHPALQRGLLLPPTGESRAAFLHARTGRLAAVRAMLEQQTAGRFATLSSPDALEAGLFGACPWTEETAQRAGDLLLVARGGAFVGRDREDVPSLPLGRHGGLTPEEMLIPYLAVRLDAV